MTDEQVDELLKDLDRALAIEPSPSVLASARMRFEERRSRSSRIVWIPLAAAIVMAVSLVWYQLLPLAPMRPAPISSLPVAAALEPTPPSTTLPPDARSGRVQRRPPTRAQRAALTVTKDSGAGATVEPLVPPDELILIRGLLANARTDSVTTVIRTTDQVSEIVALPKLEPLKIAALEISPIERFRVDDRSAQ